MSRPRPTPAPRRPGVASADVIYEDDHLLVANKPAGVTTTAGRSDARRSLHDAVLDHVRSNADASMRVRPVNHLDRAVSGLVVFAKSKRMEDALETLFRRNTVRRTYCAVVRGRLGSAEGDTGTVQTTNDPHPKRGRRSAPSERPATPAITHYRVVSHHGDVSLVQLRPETHRNNQLILHMRQLEHPIVGDEPASPRGPSSPLLLHFEQIAFEHPRTGRDVRVIAPRPPEFDRAIGATPPPKEKPSKRPAADTSWQGVAEWYGNYQSAERSDHFADVIHPGALALLGSVRGGRVLDVACGEGTFASILAGRGASVVGIDAAADLIDQARAKAIAGARFVVANAARLDDAGKEARGPFDAASCIMALMNIAELDATLAGIARRLAPGAPFVAVLLHPAFRSPRQTAWGWDTSDRRQQRQYRRVDAYLSETRTPIVMNPGKAAHGEPVVETWTFHRPVSAYVRSLSAAGFVVDALDEWPSLRTSEPGPRADEENRARAEIPLFLGIRAIRSNRTD